jgi:hypothetical protein
MLVLDSYLARAFLRYRHPNCSQFYLQLLRIKAISTKLRDVVKLYETDVMLVLDSYLARSFLRYCQLNCSQFYLLLLRIKAISTKFGDVVRL